MPDMPYLNRYSFIGNLTKAPELRFQPAGEKQALCLLNVAINRDSRDESGEKRTQTTFVNDIEVWGPSGEACAHFLTLGSLVLVEGRMDLDQWQDKQTGAKRSRMKVVAENVQFLRIRRPGDDPIPDPPPASAAEPAQEQPVRRPVRRAPRTARTEV
jgi:single-strand DNA-binding protein